VCVCVRERERESWCLCEACECVCVCVLCDVFKCGCVNGACLIHTERKRESGYVVRKCGFVFKV
jgi:hypothetical protein